VEALFDLAPRARANARPAVKILDIGSFEGRSAVFFLKYLPGSTIVCIDTFAGTPEEGDND
jgi:hypothetical protein